MDNRLPKDLHCDQCSMQFDKKCEYDNHLESMNHGIVIEKKKKPVTLRNQSHQAKKSIHCEICKAGFQSKHGLKIHEESVHDGKKPFECNICKKTFALKQNLKRHINSIHKGKKPFICEICETGFQSKHGLKLHEESVHDGKNAIFVKMPSLLNTI